MLAKVSIWHLRHAVWSGARCMMLNSHDEIQAAVLMHAAPEQRAVASCFNQKLYRVSLV